MKTSIDEDEQSGLSPLSLQIYSDPSNSKDNSSEDGIFRSFSFEDRMHSTDEIRKERSLSRILLAAKERKHSASPIASPRRYSSKSQHLSQQIVPKPSSPRPNERPSTASQPLVISTQREDKARRQNSEGNIQLFAAIPEPYPHSNNFQRVTISDTGEAPDADTSFACSKLKACMALRDKYIGAHPFPPQDQPKFFSHHSGPEDVCSGGPEDAGQSYRRRPIPPYDIFEEPIPARPKHTLHYQFQMVRGVMLLLPDPADETGRQPVWDDLTLADSAFPVLSFKDYVEDYHFIRKVVHAGPVSSYAYKRLELLAARFSLHILLNDTKELDAQKSVPHRDFYNVRKVDTHVHHSACMNQKHLLRFIKSKLKYSSNEAVIFRDGRFLTIGEVFESLNLTAYDLSIDTLDMHANNTFHRFDRFNLKYSPAGQSRLREIFLKSDNVISGKYLAEITKEVINDLEASKYQLTEWRISIYGRKASEWASLARWFYVNRLAHSNVRWLIQIPRLYDIYKRGGEIDSFGQMLNNIFAPLFVVSLDPESNPPLHYFLQAVVGIDIVDDESKPEHEHLTGSTPTPEQWTSANSPPYSYWMYYIYANLCVLNKLRASRGLCTFQFRPHCGEAGDVDHLIATYLVAHQINHGIMLRKNPSLQYLYYLSQVGIAMSPLSNNKLFLDYNKSPFPKYFHQGLNVSLSTDDPLMLHYTKDPLLEEYSVAAQVWKLSSTDQCEIARNSVLQSGWERRFKLHFLGEDLCDIKETNVPLIRLAYRKETLQGEIDDIEKLSAAK